MDQRLADIARRILAATDLHETEEHLRDAADVVGVNHVTVAYGIDPSKIGPIPHILSTQPPEYWQDYRDSRIYEVSPTPKAVLEGAPRVLLLSSLESGSRVHQFLSRWGIAQLTVVPLASPEKSGLILAYSDREMDDPHLILQLSFLGGAVMLAAGPLLSGEKRRKGVLTDSEIAVLRWVAVGKSNTDIAAITEKSRRSVDDCVARILRKLDVSSRVQAAAWFLATNAQND